MTNAAITNVDFVVIIRTLTLSMGAASMALLVLMLVTFAVDRYRLKKLAGFKPIHFVLSFYALFETVQDTTILMGRLDDGDPQTALLYPTLASKAGLLVGLALIFREMRRRLRGEVDSLGDTEVERQVKADSPEGRRLSKSDTARRSFRGEVAP